MGRERREEKRGRRNEEGRERERGVDGMGEERKKEGDIRM